MKERTNCDEDLGVCDVCFYSETFENNYSTFFFFYHFCCLYNLYNHFSLISWQT